MRDIDLMYFFMDGLRKGLGERKELKFLKFGILSSIDVIEFIEFIFEINNSILKIFVI
jgi:hypothetical protein